MIIDSYGFIKKCLKSIIYIYKNILYKNVVKYIFFVCTGYGQHINVTFCPMFLKSGHIISSKSHESFIFLNITIYFSNAKELHYFKFYCGQAT